jgi:biotin carboxyl carrier protein
VGIFGRGDGYVLRQRHGTEVVVHGQRFVLDEPNPWDRRGSAADGVLTAPMPGTVLEVRVGEGDAVEEGQVLGVMEAMKMELALKAPFAGKVTTVRAAAGEQVQLGDTLFVVEASDEPA